MIILSTFVNEKILTKKNEKEDNYIGFAVIYECFFQKKKKKITI